MVTDKEDRKRWSDSDLTVFHQEFRDHVAKEDKEQAQQQDIFDAIFRKEDKDLGTPPGLLQMMAQTNAQILDMRIRNDRHKTFVGGVVFTLSAVWVFVSEIWHRLFEVTQKL